MVFEDEEDESQTSASPDTLEDPQSIHILLPEIENEILSMLPVKSLLRCKSVCKSWRSLISDPPFVKYHLSLSEKNNDRAHHRLIMCTGTSVKWCPLRDVIYDKSINTLELDYPLKHTHNDVWIIGSCNGLLCIFVEDEDEDVYDEGTVFIWNPSTRRSNRLPSSSFKGSDFHGFGFGYDESSDDYKVVSLATNGANNITEIYSLKSGNWKIIGDFPHGLFLAFYVKFSSGALHWPMSRSFSSSSSCTIVSLDLATEMFGEVVQPVYDKGNNRLRLGVLGERLCLLYDYPKFRKTDVWVTKGDGVKDSWIKLVSIQNLSDRFWVPLAIANDGTILLCKDQKWVLYDIKNESFSEINNYDRDHVHDIITCITVESLVSPDAPRH